MEGNIKPEDRAWLMFLFSLDGLRRTTKHAWICKEYFTWFRCCLILYIIGYPIMFTWDFFRKFKKSV